MSAPLRAFKCSVAGSGFEWAGATVFAFSRGAAKAEFYRAARECSNTRIRFTEVRAKSLNSPPPDPVLDRVAAYRGLPAIQAGVTRVRVGDNLATVIGANESANLRIIFDTGVRGSVHPGKIEVIA